MIDAADFRVLATSNVNVRYVRGLIDLGYRRLSIADAVMLRSSSITVAKIKQLRDRLKRLPTIEKIVRHRKPGL
jgi:hypothetical protein